VRNQGITLLDYGMANLLNVARAFEYCGAVVNVVDAIREFCKSGKPIMGICVGMQMLFDHSEEFGVHQGLGVMPGSVRAVPNTTVQSLPQRVPHIGWNHLVEPELGRDWKNTLLKPFAGKNPAFYFVHSFMANPEQSGDRLADCLYGGHRICAAVQRENIVATQFHPERSGEAGLALIREFLTW
jgi:glutamine amidotransferase